MILINMLVARRVLWITYFIDDYDFNQIKTAIFTKKIVNFLNTYKKYLKNKNISFEEFDFTKKEIFSII